MGLLFFATSSTPPTTINTATFALISSNEVQGYQLDATRSNDDAE